MGIRIDRTKVDQLSETLKAWAEDVEQKARQTDQSLHDALVDLQDQSLTPLSHAQCVELMSALDEHWDN